MPFDPHDSPHPPGPGGLSPAGLRPDRLVAGWLLAVCAMLLGMIMLGGATRLTGSGLSIMEWAPLSGILPPLREAEWQRLFALYQQIPQYRLINDGFGIEGFRHIFWLEWTHRLWGRLIGVVFLLPLIAFAATGRIPRRLVPRLVVLFLLGGLQGAVGWFMVASGFFADSTAVAPSRLVIHLALAVALYAAVFWTALDLWPRRPVPPDPLLRRLTQGLAGLLALTILAGGFVAGLHAGLSYNSFPLMDGRLIPRDYAQLPSIAANLTQNIAAVQFDHRLLATLTALLALATVAIGLSRPIGRPLRPALLVLAAAVAGQYALGVATLLAVVPVGLATAHQGMAILVVTAVLLCLHPMRHRIKS